MARPTAKTQLKQRAWSGWQMRFWMNETAWAVLFHPTTIGK
jgi:hypothetical protein